MSRKQTDRFKEITSAFYNDPTIRNAILQTTPFVTIGVEHNSELDEDFILSLKDIPLVKIKARYGPFVAEEVAEYFKLNPTPEHQSIVVGAKGFGKSNAAIEATVAANMAYLANEATREESTPPAAIENDVHVAHHGFSEELAGRLLERTEPPREQPMQPQIRRNTGMQRAPPFGFLREEADTRESNTMIARRALSVLFGTDIGALDERRRRADRARIRRRG